MKSGKFSQSINAVDYCHRSLCTDMHTCTYLNTELSRLYVLKLTSPKSTKIIFKSPLDEKP